MNKDELGQLYPVFIAEYDNNWPALFEKEKGILHGIFGPGLKIEHIGSTAVPGLSAKPTIDILIEKPGGMADEAIIRKMEGNGYIHMKEQTRHLMFVKGYTPAGLEKESYHIHMGPRNQNWLWDRVHFCDYLKNHGDEARAYERLKKELAEKHRNDREAYTEAKAYYINAVTGMAKRNKAHATDPPIPVSREAAAGAAVYSRFILSIYDVLVMQFENHFVWKCPTRTIVDFYNQHVSDRHLDVGVGTGYFLDRCAFPGRHPVIHLMDLNRNSLEKTSRRIRRYQPAAHLWNILEPITIDLQKFNSICISNILHCLPGNFNDKQVVFQNLKRFLNPGGVLFGLTILGSGVKVGPLYYAFNGIYNRLAIFSNRHDDATGLEKILKSNFGHYTMTVVGSVAFFSCKI